MKGFSKVDLRLSKLDFAESRMTGAFTSKTRGLYQIKTSESFVQSRSWSFK